MNKMVLETKKADSPNNSYDKIYGIHKYWSRKPWKPINEFISKYSNESDLVVDLFLGSGVMALESISQNRNFVGFDLNPVAIFIAENTLDSNFNEEEFSNEFSKLMGKIEKPLLELYSADEKCKKCGNNLVINHINSGPKFKGKETGYFFCYYCGKNQTKSRRSLKPKELEDLNKKSAITDWVPNNYFPKKFYKDRFSYKGVEKITDMFSSRNLYALSKLLFAIKNSNLRYENLFLLAFSNTLLHASKLKGENVRPLGVNNYWIPDDYIEENVLIRFVDRVKKVKISKINLLAKLSSSNKIGKYRLLNQSSFVTNLPTNSVDYIITDPPYGEAIQYSELSSVWNAWLNKEFDIKEEVIINPEQEKGHKEYLSLLENCIKEGSRILKKGKLFTLCFHNKDFKIWKEVLDIFKKNDFSLMDVSVVGLLGNSYNNNWAKFSPKTDIYVTFKKTKFEGFTHKKEYSIESLIDGLSKKDNLNDFSKIYDKIISKLIWESFYNEHQIDISSFSIKQLEPLIGEVKNGN